MNSAARQQAHRRFMRLAIRTARRGVRAGQTPFGDSDPRPNLLVMRGGRLTAEQLRVENSSLASQAVGPAVNNVEMSYEGRSWPKIGKKMLALRPLALQTVSPDDSVLGSLADRNDRGLVRPGMKADITIFDPATVVDTATFQSPHQYAVGFRAVIVNGEVVFENGAMTDARPGRVLYGPGKP